MRTWVEAACAGIGMALMISLIGAAFSVRRVIRTHAPTDVGKIEEFIKDRAFDCGHGIRDEFYFPGGYR